MIILPPRCPTHTFLDMGGWCPKSCSFESVYNYPGGYWLWRPSRHVNTAQVGFRPQNKRPRTQDNLEMNLVTGQMACERRNMRDIILAYLIFLCKGQATCCISGPTLFKSCLTKHCRWNKIINSTAIMPNNIMFNIASKPVCMIYLIPKILQTIPLRGKKIIYIYMYVFQNLTAFSDKPTVRARVKKGQLAL